MQKRGILKFFSSSPEPIAKSQIPSPKLLCQVPDKPEQVLDEPEQVLDKPEHNLICFTDGSAINNGKTYCKAAYAVIWPDYPDFNYGDKVLPATNNRAEYSGAICALKQANIIDPIYKLQLHIYTDSMLLINSMTKWLSGWKKNGFMTKNKTKVLNQDLLLELDKLVQKRRTHFHHVKAHTNASTWEAKYNDMADKLARLTTIK